MKSLEGWKKGVGCTGGEPTLHPQFPEICGLFRRLFPKQQCGLWTCGGASYEKYRELIHDTFGIINYNDHKSPCFHHPVMIASEEVIEDEKLRNELIDNCWLQLHWSPLITPKGAFFCEVAATFDMLFDGHGGYSLEPNWWKRSVAELKDQRERYCRYCSIPIPMESLPDTLDYDYTSKGNAKRLIEAGSPQAKKGKLTIIDKIYTYEDIQGFLRTKTRPSKKYALSDSKHFWVKTPLVAWFWKKAKYNYMSNGRRKFFVDTVKFLLLKLRDTFIDLIN